MRDRLLNLSIGTKSAPGDLDSSESNEDFLDDLDELEEEEGERPPLRLPLSSTERLLLL